MRLGVIGINPALAACVSESGDSPSSAGLRGAVSVLFGFLREGGDSHIREIRFPHRLAECLGYGGSLAPAQTCAVRRRQVIGIRAATLTCYLGA